MSFLEFSCPPLLHYIASGEYTYSIGQTHPNRRNIGVFDLLVVTSGRLFVGEGEEQWTIGPKQALILQPDKHHYSTGACQEPTHFYWLHFQSYGEWMETLNDSGFVRNPNYISTKTDPNLVGNPAQLYSANLFSIRLPRFCSLTASFETIENLHSLTDLNQYSQNASRWEQQIIFQKVLRGLNGELEQRSDSAVNRVAEMAATFIRRNYRTTISYKQLGETLNFHPNYIARCMQQVFGCTPLEYLVQFRLEQAKLLLMNTQIPIGHIAEEVGFHQVAYFTRSFSKIEGVTPRMYRKKYQT